MAYWKRLKSGAVRGWNSDKSSIPRDSLRHLDNLSDDQVEAHFQNLNATAKVRKLDPEKLSEKTRELIERFCRWKAGRGKHKDTVQQERHNLQIVALFFDPKGPVQTWPQHSMQLRSHLLDQGYKEPHIHKIQGTTNRFWEYARKHLRIVAGVLDFDDAVEHSVVGETPLRRHATPEEVLTFVENCEHTDIKLIALLGYFASMRPQEIFATNRNDFIGGDDAENLECCKVMRAAGLFAGMAVYVQRQRGSRINDIRPPKWKTIAHVAIFSEEAALLLVQILTDLPVDLPFVHGNRHYTDRWKLLGMNLWDPKDPRRASIYWLANYSRLELVPLSLHARHKDTRTTGRYYRRVETPAAGKKWSIKINKSA